MGGDKCWEHVAGWGPPVMWTWVYKPWNKPYENYSYIYHKATEIRQLSYLGGPILWEVWYFLASVIWVIWGSFYLTLDHYRMFAPDGFNVGTFGRFGTLFARGNWNWKNKQTLPVGFAVNDVPLESRIQLDFTQKELLLGSSPHQYWQLINCTIGISIYIYAYIYIYIIWAIDFKIFSILRIQSFFFDLFGAEFSSRWPWQVLFGRAGLNGGAQRFFPCFQWG